MSVFSATRYAGMSARVPTPRRSQTLTPAAIYLRMSTEHQQYSLENQLLLIQRYAHDHGFVVVQTYTDAAKSGVLLRNRSGLRQLLQDVMSSAITYKAILVYDISRWGRFQDIDESAHYEFVCKSAGVPVHYCAETFPNDGSLPSLMMKALKRTMAGEYSRELSGKVFEGQRRLAERGFKQGGLPGYGLRRLLVSAERLPKQILKNGERKSIATDRVILIPGTPEEVECVRNIYRMLISEKRTVHGIATELNCNGIPYLGTSKWDSLAVYNILTHPKYAGCHVYGRTSQKLYGQTLRLPRDKWTTTPGAFEQIVDEATFHEAQRVLQNRTINRSDEELLDMLRSLLGSQGRLSLRIIQRSDSVPSPSVYRARFGSLRKAYQLIGYGKASDFGPIDLRRRTQALREELMSEIQSLFPAQISIVRGGGRWRSRLRLRENGVLISVLIGRAARTSQGQPCWRVAPVARECTCPTLIALLNAENGDWEDNLYLFPRMDRKNRFQITLNDPWLELGTRASTVHFCEILDAIRHNVILNPSSSCCGVAGRR